MKRQLERVKRGYAYIEMNECGCYFFEGDYDILGLPLTDADDELHWASSQPSLQCPSSVTLSVVSH